MKLSIGEFSRVTSLTVKTLRLYHDKGILIPTYVDSETGYRYYDERNTETARVITILRGFEFSLKDIKSILNEIDDDAQLHAQLQSKRLEIMRKMEQYQKMNDSIDEILRLERETAMYEKKNEQQFEIEEKTVDTLLVAGYPMSGKYNEIGKGFQKVSKTAGRFICGKPIGLYYDGEFKENDASFEACYPVRKGNSTDQVRVRELAGGKAVTLIHQGAYDTLGNSYSRLFDYMEQRGYKRILPSREIYIRGPGMIFRGNPKNYLTEIQFLLSDE